MNRPFIKVILESPFGGDTAEDIARNIRYARACMRDCVLRGESPYASHGLLTQPGVLCDEIPEEREAGIQAGFAWRQTGEKTVVYEDLGISRGMKYGIDNAMRNGAQVEHRSLGPDWEKQAIENEKKCPGKGWKVNL